MNKKIFYIFIFIFSISFMQELFAQTGKLDISLNLGSTFTNAAKASINAGIGLNIRISDNFNIRPSFDFNQFKNPEMEIYSFSADALYGTNFYNDKLPGVYILGKLGFHKATAGVLESEFEAFYGAGTGFVVPLSPRFRIFLEGEYCQGFGAERGYFPVKIGAKIRI
jgi:hypothetical protein